MSDIIDTANDVAEAAADRAITAERDRAAQIQAGAPGSCDLRGEWSGRLTMRPILFSAPMVRAILAGTKTQTRRVCKPAESAGLSFVVGPFDCPELGRGFFGDEEGDVQFQCPYGKPGDRLWVRETWRTDAGYDAYAPNQIDSGASLFFLADQREHRINRRPECGPHEWGKTRVSIHMPRWASRILLEIVAIRVERLQDISGSDAANEGVQVPCDVRGRPLLRLTGKVPPSKFSGKHAQDWTADDYLRFEYAELWESINGPGSWDANPWVWCVEFRRVKP
jgi:hypothetical protein